MLGGMEEDPDVGDPLLAKLLGLEFGRPSNEDTVSCKLHQLLLCRFCGRFRPSGQNVCGEGV